MQWTIEELKRSTSQLLRITDIVNVNDLKYVDKQIRNISPVRVVGEASITSNVISFHLNLTGHMVLPCALTLEDVDYPFSIDTVESFQLDNRVVDWELDDNEEVHMVEGNMIDLLPYIKENILLHVPMRVIKPNAKIEASGKDWSIVSEKEQKNKIDPRFAKLKTLFDELNDKKSD